METVVLFVRYEDGIRIAELRMPTAPRVGDFALVDSKLIYLVERVTWEFLTGDKVCNSATVEISFLRER